MTEPPPLSQYWFQVHGQTPVGPMSVAQFLEQYDSLTAGPVQYCSVGEPWQPFVALADVVPLQSATSNPSASATPPTMPTTSTTPPAKTSEPAEWIATAVGVVLVAIVGYLIYEWARPLTPREVVEHFENCKTVEQAKALCTTNLHPALVTLYLLDDRTTSDQDSQDVLLDEGGSSFEHSIRVETSFFEKAANRRVAASMRVKLRKSDGWKMDDISYLSYDGQTLPEPFSLAQNHLVLLQEFQQNKPVRPTGSTVPVAQKHWTEEKKTAGAVGFLTWKFLATGGAKTVGLVLLAIGGVIYGAIRSRRTSGTTT